MYLHREYLAQVIFQILAPSIVHGLASPIIAPQMGTRSPESWMTDLNTTTETQTRAISIVCLFNNISTPQAYNSNYMPMIYSLQTPILFLQV